MKKSHFRWVGECSHKLKYIHHHSVVVVLKFSSVCILSSPVCDKAKHPKLRGLGLWTKCSFGSSRCRYSHLLEQWAEILLSASAKRSERTFLIAIGTWAHWESVTDVSVRSIRCDFYGNLAAVSTGLLMRCWILIILRRLAIFRNSIDVRTF